MYADLRKYLKNKVKELFAKTSDEPIDAFGANDFLPDDVREGSQKEKKTEGFAGKIQKLHSKEMPVIDKRTKRNEIDVDNDPEGDSGIHSGKGRSGKEHPKNGGKAKENGEEKGFQYVAIKERVICENRKKGIYTIRFVVPNNAKKARMDFIINGEQSNYKFLVKSARVSSGAIHIDNVKDNKVYFSNIKKNDKVLLELEMDFDQYCLMEVNYFENKK